ncbi:MAG: hypothetical protein KAS72_00115 [Phycisphaerales bacterium]|nr:hypothetical protein [Phycisphaerales bacterium]
MPVFLPVYSQRWEGRFLPRDVAEPEAIEQIELMSLHEAWWARLYAAHIMQQEPEFQSPERLARLATDQNILVRETIATITSDQTEEGSEPEPPNDAGDGGGEGAGG